MENHVTTQFEPFRQRTLIALSAFILLAGVVLGLWKQPGYLMLAITSLATGCLIGTRLKAHQHASECAKCHRQDGSSRFRELMEHYPTVAFLKDLAGQIVYTNPAYCKAFGIDPEQRMTKSDFDIMPRALAEQLRANDRKVIESKSPYQFEEELVDRAGKFRTWLTFKFPVADYAGSVFIAGIGLEITETVGAQKALRESESRYRQIVEYAGDIIARCDSSGRLIYINEMGARILKIPTRQLYGRRALRLVRPDARRRARTVVRQAVMEGSTDLYVEIPVTTGDGSELWLGQTIRVLRNGNSIQGYQAICRDITDQRRIEEKLRASEERFRQLYEHGPVAHNEMDREGVIQRVNRASCDMLGFSEAELVGKSVYDLIPPEQREAERAFFLAKLSGDVTLQPFNRLHARPDGRRVRLEIHENLVHDSQGQVIGIHAVLLDVTQRHLAEMLDRDRWKVSEMMAQQQPLDRVLSTIAAMIGHQDETLSCVPVRLNEQQLEPVCTSDALRHLCEVIGNLGTEAFSIWPVDEFRVNKVSLADLTGTRTFGKMAAVARHLGMDACWSIPIISSSRQPLGLLLTFSPRIAEPTLHEQKMIEATCRISALAIEHRYLTDLLAFQASHDCLTRLPNRSTFEARLQDAIGHAKQHGEQLALFFVDLDRFKDVNDTFGHCGGDELLRQVAGRLRRCTRHTDVLARIGGDEFSLLLSGIREPVEANRLAEAILQAFDSPFEIAGWPIQVTASIGISFYPRDGLDAPTLQRNSDTAMYRVKNTGKNSFGCYTGGEHAPVAYSQ